MMLDIQTKIPLHFHPDGSFRILMMSDSHHSWGEDDITMRSMGLLIDRTKPDFVLLVGDQITGPTDDEKFRYLLKQLVSPIEERRIPWAHVFGNHDAPEGIAKELQEKYYEAYPHCISKAGPEELTGVGNWFIPILDDNDHPVFGVWGLDSHQDFKFPDCQTDFGGDPYWTVLMPNRLVNGSDSDFVRADQVRWYTEQSAALEAAFGKKIPSLMMLHIPLPEFNCVLTNADRCGLNGEYNEKVCCSEINGGLFAAALQRGDVKGIYAGHDHINTFEGTYCGIRLGYDGGIGFHTYGHRNAPDGDIHRLRGGRVFEINAADPAHYTSRMVFIKDLMKEQ